MRERDHDLGKAAKRDSSIKHTSETMLRQIKRVSKFWREYDGAKAIEAIDDKVMRGFISWRKTYYHGKEDIPSQRQARSDGQDAALALTWPALDARQAFRT
jgi:hypothetical protein